MTASRPDTLSHIHFLIWLLIMNVVAFALFTLFDQGHAQTMFAADRSYLTYVILIVFLGGSSYIAWHILAVSRKLSVAGSFLVNEPQELIRLASISGPSESLTRNGDDPAAYIKGFVAESVDLVRDGKSPPNDSHDETFLLEIYADDLRSAVDMGSFIVDMLFRMGLIGTIIGFILMLRSLVDGPLPQADGIQELLITMSSGMGTAFYTTLAGLVSATLMGIQVQVLGRGVEKLVGNLIRIGQRCRREAVREGASSWQ